ncbi:MYX family subclass B1 metallo-beta-lactamase [Corallococcus macrosporus]|uniref:beta-lactamase n=1 Tax=Corallococcus macrosporus DSM 14697 TaxID=1189310 RepID=A0A250JLW8_9BACT|nr:subclass B1 metallo-beta-lactamase [Corallococcus macrosporus]ATB44889.1 subclass B1 metallo-beta-lactamase [Corallococcus macrosporus DSM 14697]
MMLAPPRWACAGALLITLSTACTRTAPAAAVERNLPVEAQPQGPDAYVLADDVSVRKLAPGVWLHVTEVTLEPFGRVSTNGLIIEEGETSLLVDTGWDARQGALLLDWARDTLRRPVRAAVVTHFHADRLGGVPALVPHGIPVRGLAETARIATSLGRQGPWETFTESSTVGSLELFFPGAGHAKDNIVVWHRDSGVLFGGCFVKDGAATNLGNVEDADVAAWPTSLARTRQRFPEARVVVPGHGQPGGPELLSHTEALLR